MRGDKMRSIGEIGFIHTPAAWTYLRLAATTERRKTCDSRLGHVGHLHRRPKHCSKTTQGRININSLINPKGTDPQTQRLVPLDALLNSLGVPPATLAAQIYDDHRVDRYGMKLAGASGVFDTIGEICEIPQLAGAGTTEADKEATIRRIANLITVRSSTFTIWVLAQSIKQPPTTPTFGTFTLGTDLITSDVRAQAVVERYEVGGVPKFPPATSATSTTDRSLTFRLRPSTIFHRPFPIRPPIYHFPFPIPLPAATFFSDGHSN